MKSDRVRWQEQSFWQLVFSQSRVNGAPYDGERLETSRWHWPTNTYLQRRRRYLRSQPLEHPSGDEPGQVYYEAMREETTGRREDFARSSLVLRSS